MEPPTHQMTDLFKQLGLSERPQDMAGFIARHRPLPDRLALPDAPFWNPAQSDFLREGLAQDADWAVVVDQLDASLRNSKEG